MGNLGKEQTRILQLNIAEGIKTMVTAERIKEILSVAAEDRDAEDIEYLTKKL